MSLEAEITEGLAATGMDLPEAASSRFAAYLRLIAKWNRVHNLTAVRETSQMVIVHLLDSLSVLPHLASARTIVDVGSGAGLPGIPIAIARPEAQITLLEASHKKCAFLQQAKTELGLANVTVVCERVEHWRPQQRFEAVVSRALSELAEFVDQAQHLLAPGGRLIAMKGVYPYEELAKVPATHRVSQVLELRVPKLEAKRHLIFLEPA